MERIIGIDIGSSTTKIVELTSDKQLIGSLQLEAADGITSAPGALDHYLQQYKVSIKDISAIVLTGVGASFLEEDLYGIPTYKVSELEAIGYGGLKLSGLDEALVVSMGTGTAFIRASKNGMIHIGGTGVGGGTLCGLSSKLIQEDDIFAISKLSDEGSLMNVDMLIKDICRDNIHTLPLDLTASNFGKIKKEASSSDIALGLINMVFQVIGMLSVFACRNDSVKDVVLTGTLSNLPQAKPIFKQMGSLYGLNFIIPEQATFATAIGAIIAYLKK